MGMRGKREAGNREEAGLPQGTEKEELHVTGSPIGSGMTAEVVSGMTPYKKAGMTPASTSFPRSDTGTHKKGSPKSDSESGRSMVETLGVLAIMGLLAIGGIMAYRYAVTKYQANETFNELRRRVVIHSQQSITGAPLSQVEMGDTTQLGYPIAVARVDSGFFELTLQDIDNNLCREMVRTGWTLPTQTRVNGVVVGTNPEACGEENVLVFRFQTEMGGCKTDADCPCGTCESGTCWTSCSSGESCVKNFDDGQYVCCPGESVKGRFCCETVNEAGDCCDADGNCCPPEKPLIDSQGRCHDCDETTQNIAMGYGHHDWGRQRCAVCDNRTFVATATNTNSFCSLPCPEGLIFADNGTCVSCFDEKDFSAPQEECFKCPNRFIAVNWTSNAYGCYRCDYPSAHTGFYEDTEASIATCEKNCPNRTLIRSEVSSVCALNCPTADQGLDQSGQCHTCDEESEYFDVWGIWDSCYQCEGVRFIGDHMNRAGRCFRCDSPQQSIFLSYVGKDEAVLDSCRACPNRVVINGSYCAKYCENGKIWDSRGECHTCDEEADFNVQGVPENKCACPGVRYLDGNTCKKCPEDVSALTPEQQTQCGG